jgi:hypothetical protein
MVLKPRVRMVSFRLSEEEYDGLKNLCLSEGARSVSELARSTICRLLGSPNGSPVQTLEKRVQELDQEIKRLSLLVERPLRGGGRKRS